MMELSNIGNLITLFLSFLILFTYYTLITCKRTFFSYEKIIVSLLLTSTQIIATELVLGILGILTPLYLFLLNSIISFTLIFLCHKKNINILSHLKSDIKLFKGFLNEVNSPYIIFLLILTILASIWLFLSSILLPPRGIDDLTYHLPVVYEYIINEKLVLLPVEYRPHVAFPMNAELLFLWPTIFIKNLKYIGMVQLFFAYLGVVVVYSLARILSISRENSFIAGLLFLLTPVVLTQSGVAYIDLILSVFFIMGLYFSVRFYITGENNYLYISGISIGLMLGMKYTMILTAGVLQIIIILAILNRKTKYRYIAVYILIICLCSGYWYIRNFIELSNPIYPLSIVPKSITFINLENNYELNYLAGKFADILKLLYKNDVGIGSLHGGFGLVFWGMAFPCWFYCFIKSLYSEKRNKFVYIFIWSQLLLGIAYFMFSPKEVFYRFPRYSIFMIPIGMIALSAALEKFKKNRFYSHSLLCMSCMFCLLSGFQLAKSKIPSYSVDIPIYDIMRNKDYSEFRYLRPASTSMAFLYETLDYITQDANQSLDVYFANSILDYAAPVYGSKIQNRVSNFKKDQPKDPDALLLLIDNTKKTRYYGQEITLEAATLNKDYRLIDFAQSSYLFIKKALLDSNRSIRESLIRHYQNYYESEIINAYEAYKLLDSNIPIVTSSFNGIGFFYLRLNGIIDNYIYLVPPHTEKSFAETNEINEFYSSNSGIEGYRNTLIFGKSSDKNNNKLYYNYSD